MDQEPNTTPNQTPGTQFTPPAGNAQPGPQPPLPPQPQPPVQPASQPQFDAPAPSPQPSLPPQPSQPSNGKKKIWLTIGVVVVVLIIAALLFIFLGKKKDDTSANKNTNTSATSNTTGSTTPGNASTSDKFTKYDVKDVTGIQYSVLFYKDAKPQVKNNLTYLIGGDANAQSSVYLTPGSTAGSQADCTSAGLTPTTMKINGKQTTVCYTSGNLVYMGFTTVNGVIMRVNVAAQKGISIEDAKTILESITFK